MIQLSNEQLSVLHELSHQPEESFQFLTGRAGTGKTTLAEEFIKRHRCVVLAPTALAAVAIGGQTIHSFFRMSIDPVDPWKRRAMAMEVFDCIDRILIDEVSMTRIDVMQQINNTLQITDPERRPFGGKKIVAVGDMRQLPPVVGSNRDIHKFLMDNYGSIYFHQAPVFDKVHINSHLLKQVYRQADDPNYLALLDRIGLGYVVTKDFIEINMRALVRPDKGTIILCSTNDSVDKYNGGALRGLPGSPSVYTGIIKGSFDPRNDCLSPVELSLKPGAKVMFTKNSSLWVNGQRGVVLSCGDDSVEVETEGYKVDVAAAEWLKINWKLKEKTDKNQKFELLPSGVGSYQQLPLRLGYAITIHKSQGMTFDKIHIDAGRGMFSHGQLYVALSRVKSLEGLTIKGQITRRDLVYDAKSELKASQDAI